MYNIQYLGVWSAFGVPSDKNLNETGWQTSLALTAQSGKLMLVDVGTDARFSCAQAGIKVEDIDAVYLSHIHADHVGGMEWLAFKTYFNPLARRPILFVAEGINKLLWYASLRGGLRSTGAREVLQEDYFETRSARLFFEWEGIKFTLVKTLHIERKLSFGLLLQEGDGPVIFFTSDVQFTPEMLKDEYYNSSLILQDCETSPFPTGVHARFDQLCELPPGIKRKMILDHYEPGTDNQEEARKNGFVGFAQKGDVFEIGGGVDGQGVVLLDRPKIVIPKQSEVVIPKRPKIVIQ